MTRCFPARGREQEAEVGARTIRAAHNSPHPLYSDRESKPNTGVHVASALRGTENVVRRRALWNCRSQTPLLCCDAFIVSSFLRQLEIEVRQNF